MASLAQPGGNVTGTTNRLGDLGGKVLQLITEIVPKRFRVAVLGDSANPGSITIWKTVVHKRNGAHTMSARPYCA